MTSEHDVHVDMTLMFVANDNGRVKQLWLLNLQGSDPGPITEDQRDRWLSSGHIDVYTEDDVGIYYIPAR